MLNHIHIKNFAIIDELSRDLDNGLTVVTGETGAGKSIMIDAIGLVLGDRAEQGVVRQGADKSEITLTLELNKNPALLQWLQENDLDSDDCCILRRVITQEGRSRAYINGSPTTLSVLRELAEQLVNIHGQHAHQLLLKQQTQREILDAFAGLEKPLAQLKKAFKDYQACRNKLQALYNASDEHQAQVDLLTFQLNELMELNPAPNEAQELEKEQRRLAHADMLINAANTSAAQLYDGEGSTAYELLNQALQRIDNAKEKDDRFSSVAELLDSALIQIEESVSQLRDIGSSIEADPQQLQHIDNRLGNFHSLAKKHHINPEELYNKTLAMSEQLTSLQGEENNAEALEEKLKTLESAFIEKAEKISLRRKTAAKKMAKEISTSMQELGMTGGRFEITLDTLPKEQWKPWGIDQIEFTVAANPGQLGGSLAKVASGGELSRISLAIQLLATQNSHLPTMIFDEVDSGIGGGIAEVVGQKLRTLGSNAQVFCVTHLPQVAAQGHQHLQVKKTKTEKDTETRIVALSDSERVEEIARMLGGIEITDTTRQHAQEMLKKAESIT